jgi:hypothetical protein
MGGYAAMAELLHRRAEEAEARGDFALANKLTKSAVDCEWQLVLCRIERGRA